MRLSAEAEPVRLSSVELLNPSWQGRAESLMHADPKAPSPLAGYTKESSRERDRSVQTTKKLCTPVSAMLPGKPWLSLGSLRVKDTATSKGALGKGGPEPAVRVGSSQAPFLPSWGLQFRNTFVYSF